MSKANLAVAYMRVSTDASTQALGLEAQRAAIDSWARQQSVTIRAYYTEEVSGGAPLHKRPILLQAIAAVETLGASQLVVQRLDRFSRDAVAAVLAEAELRKHGAGLAVTDGPGTGDDPTSKLVRGILLMVGQFERELINARIKAALDAKRARGQHVGRAPYGQRYGEHGALVPHAGEQETLRQVSALRLEGLTVREISNELARRGHLTRNGKPFSASSIHAMLPENRSVERLEESHIRAVESHDET